MKWKTPPIIKIYEALGSIADNRIKVNENKAKVYSSSKNKFYNVEYKENQIMANDNGSYWVGYLGYPSIAFLMLKEILPYDKNYAKALKNIAWKDINTKFKNDFKKTQKDIDSILIDKGIDLDEFYKYLDSTLEIINNLELEHLGKRKKPPKGY